MGGDLGAETGSQPSTRYTEGAAPRLEGEDDRAYAKRVIDQLPAPAPEHVREDAASYFDDTSNLLPVAAMVSTKTPEENAKGGTNGLKRFAAAREGVIGKREPVTLHDNGDGTFSVLDGNGTLTAAQAAGWKQLPARIVSATVPNNPELQARYDAAAKAYPDYQASMRAFAAAVGGKFIDPGLKSVTRTLQKVNGEYGGVVSKVKDLMRGTIEIPDYADAPGIVAQLRAKYGDPIKLKSSLDPNQPPPFPNGYRDVNSVFSIHGTPAEIQINLPEMLVAKEKAHPYYAEWQDIDRQLTRERRQATPEEQARIDELNRKQAAIYLPAWDAAMARLNSASETKSASSMKRVPEPRTGFPPDQSSTMPPPFANTHGLPSTKPNLVPGGNVGSVERGSVTGLTSTPIIPQTGSAWTQFGADSGTLGIPRSEMPQVKRKDRADFLNYLADHGVEQHVESVPANSLKPTQAEFAQGKVDRFKAGGPMDTRSVLVSSDGYVLDGHHQWLAAAQTGRDVPVIRLDKPIRDLLDLTNAYPKVQRSEGAPIKTLQGVPSEHGTVAPPIVRVPVAKLHLSGDVKQFKKNANEEGVVEPLQGEYDERGVGPLQVWERLDGRLEVISGRHRLDLAKRTGKADLPVQIYREADGFTKEDAMALDAELNIRDGQGSTADYVQYLQRPAYQGAAGEGLARARGLLARARGQRAYAIARSGTPELIAAHRADQLTDDQAYQIAQAGPNNLALQALGMELVNAGRPTSLAVNTMRAVESMHPEVVTNGDLFGLDDTARKTALDLAKRAGAHQRDISERLAAITGAAKRPELAKREGIDIRDPDAIQRRIEQLRAERDAWDRWQTDPAKVDQLRAEAGLPRREPPPEAPPDETEPVDDVTVPMFSRRRGGASGDLFGGAEPEAELPSAISRRADAEQRVRYYTDQVASLQRSADIARDLAQSIDDADRRAEAERRVVDIERARDDAQEQLDKARADLAVVAPPATGDLFGGPSTSDFVDAATRAKDARRNGLAGGRVDTGDGGLFDGTRPEQTDIESARPAPGDESSIVNPIPRDASPAEKLDAIHALTDENKPVVDDFLRRLDAELGTESKSSVKLDDAILSKASRPSIRAEKPWHDIEHLRDTFRFKTTLNSLHDLPAIADAIRKQGWQVVKIDTAKLLHPKEWGFRFVALDLRMPNGQLVEYYMPLREIEDVKDANHLLFEKWRNRDESELTDAEKVERAADVKQSSESYGAAFRRALARSGMDESDARASAASFADSLGPAREYSSSSTLPVTGKGALGDQRPSMPRNAKKPAPDTTASGEPESATYTRSEGSDIDTTSNRIIHLDGVEEGETRYGDTSPLSPGAERGAVADRAGAQARRRGTAAVPDGQLDLFVNTAEPPARRAAVRKNAARLLQRAELVTTGAFRSGIDRIHDWVDAAHIIAPLRKSPQEQMLAVVADQDGKPLAVIRHTIGTIDASYVEAGTLFGAIAQVPGAKQVWLAHNHPSGVVEQSASDRGITMRMRDLMQGSGIRVHGSIVVGPGRKTASFIGDDPVTGEFRRGDQFSERPITPAARRGEVPMQERRLHKVVPADRPGLTGPADMPAFVEQHTNGDSGVLFLDNRHRVVGFLPMSEREMAKLRTDNPGTGSAAVARAKAESNAAAAVVVSKDPDAARNVGKMLSDADVRVLDIADTSSGHIRSIAATGRGLTSGRPFMARRAEDAGPALDRDALERIAHAVLPEAAGAGRVVVKPWAEMPEAIRKEAARQGSPDGEGIDAVYHDGKTYLVEGRFRNRREVAEALFHEHYGHYGLRALYGSEVGNRMAFLLHKVGGIKGVLKLADEQNIDLGEYLDNVIGNKSIPIREQRLVLMEELLTHMAETTGSLRRVGQEFVGAVRDFMRRHGWKALAEYNATDLAHVLRQARRAAEAADAEGSSKRPVFQPHPGDMAASYARRIFQRDKEHPTEHDSRREPPAASRDAARVRDLVERFAGVKGAPSESAIRDAVRQYRDVEAANADVLRAHDEDGTPLPAPNGKPSKLGREQWILTRTPNFERWFGDSVVRDENGEPLVVYRGGPATDFRTGEPITSFASKNGPWAGYFTSSPGVASRFADRTSKQGVVTPVFVRMAHPLEVDANGEPARDFQIDASVIGEKDSPLRERLLSGEHDGLILRDTADEGDVFLPLKSEQVKSAIANIGTFSESSDIRFSRTAGAVREDLDAAQKETLAKIGVTPHRLNLKRWWQAHTADLGREMLQGTVDQFAPLKDLDFTAYMQARLSRGTDGAVEAMFLHGTPKLTDGALDIDRDGKERSPSENACRGRALRGTRPQTGGDLLAGVGCGDAPHKLGARDDVGILAEPPFGKRLTTRPKLEAEPIGYAGRRLAIDQPEHCLRRESWKR